MRHCGRISAGRSRRNPQIASEARRPLRSHRIRPAGLVRAAGRGARMAAGARDRGRGDARPQRRRNRRRLCRRHLAAGRGVPGHRRTQPGAATHRRRRPAWRRSRPAGRSGSGGDRRLRGAATTIAGINSPASVTIAGDADAIAALGAELEARHAFLSARLALVVRVSPSRAMDPVRGELLWSGSAGLAPLPGRNLLHLDRHRRRTRGRAAAGGAALLDGTISASRFGLFASAIAALTTEDGVQHVPRNRSASDPRRLCARRCFEERTGGSGGALATLRRQRAGTQGAVDRAPGAATARGSRSISTSSIPRRRGVAVTPARLPLATRALLVLRQRRRDSRAGAAEKEHPLLGKRQPTAEAIWKNRLDPAIVPWLADHVVQGTTVRARRTALHQKWRSPPRRRRKPARSMALEVEGFEEIPPPGGHPVRRRCSAIEIGFAAEDSGFHLLAGEVAGWRRLRWSSPGLCRSRPAPGGRRKR